MSYDAAALQAIASAAATGQHSDLLDALTKQIAQRQSILQPNDPQAQFLNSEVPYAQGVDSSYAKQFAQLSNSINDFLGNRQSTGIQAQINSGNNAQQTKNNLQTALNNEDISGTQLANENTALVKSYNDALAQLNHNIGTEGAASDAYLLEAARNADQVNAAKQQIANKQQLLDKLKAQANVTQFNASTNKKTQAAASSTNAPNPIDTTKTIYPQNTQVASDTKMPLTVYPQQNVTSKQTNAIR